MPLIEIVEGEDTSAETVSAAVTFAQAIRKQPITCAEVPGFVVNRILNSGTSEVWREQEEKGLSIKKIDEGLGAAGIIPVGPYYLVNLLGLDTVLHVAEHLAQSYGEERFYVPRGMQKLVSEGKVGAKTGGDGFYDPQPDPEQPAELVKLETRADGVAIAWLAHGQMNSISPQVAGDLAKVWRAAKAAGVRALVIASSNPFLFSAGADIKAFTTLDAASGARLVDETHALFREMGSDGTATIAAVNGLAFGGGCEL